MDKLRAAVADQNGQNELATLENLAQAIADGLKQSIRVHIPLSDHATAQYILRLVNHHSASFTRLLNERVQNLPVGTYWLSQSNQNDEPAILYAPEKAAK